MTPYGTLYEDLKVAVFDWLHNALNFQNNVLLEENSPDAVPIFRAESDAIRPERLFVEFKFLTGLNKIGTRDELLNAAGNTFKIRGQREITVSVNVIGVDAPIYAALIEQSLESPRIQDILRSAGLAPRVHENIADQSVFQETSFEERAVLDVIFGLSLELADAITYIESVEIKSDLPGGTTQIVDTN